jgi:hypothetical protein
MGDGYWDTHHKTVHICTEYFTHADVVRLITFMRNRFGIVATTSKRGDNYRILLAVLAIT